MVAKGRRRLQPFERHSWTRRRIPDSVVSDVVFLLHHLVLGSESHRGYLLALRVFPVFSPPTKEDEEEQKEKRKLKTQSSSHHFVLLFLAVV
jgi:hypothetical protein